MFPYDVAQFDSITERFWEENNNNIPGKIYFCSFFSTLYVCYVSNIIVTASHTEVAKRTCRSSHWRLWKKMFLKILQKLSGNTCVWVSFLIKLQASSLQILLKKWFWDICFPMNFAKFLRTTLLKVHLQRLLLYLALFGGVL